MFLKHNIFQDSDLHYINPLFSEYYLFGIRYWCIWFVYIFLLCQGINRICFVDIRGNVNCLITEWLVDGNMCHQDFVIVAKMINWITYVFIKTIVYYIIHVFMKTDNVNDILTCQSNICIEFLLIIMNCTCL